MRFKYSHDVFPPGLILPVRLSIIGGEDGREAKAKVDTGADISVISEELRKELNLLPRGVVSAKGAFDEGFTPSPTYFVKLYINHSFSFELQVISLPTTKYFLIGRDLLNQIILHANGPAELFEITI